MVQQLDIIHAVAEKEGLDFNFLLADLSQQVGAAKAFSALFRPKSQLSRGSGHEATE